MNVHTVPCLSFNTFHIYSRLFLCVLHTIISPPTDWTFVSSDLTPLTLEFSNFVQNPLFFSFIQFVVIKDPVARNILASQPCFFLSLCAFDWHHQGKSRFSKCGGVGTTDRNTKFSQVQYYHITCLDFYWLQKNHVKSYRCSHNFMRGNKDKTLDNSSYQLQANKPPSYISRMIRK